MNKDLMDKLRKDLKKSGLASELEARRILQKRGWSVAGGAAYLDKDERKSREIDLVANHHLTTKEGDDEIIYNDFRIYAEVKKSEKPWVVFKHYPSKYFTSCAWNNIIDYINLPCRPFKLSDALKKYSLLKVNGWEGTGIHEAFKNPGQQSRWYGGFLSAIKAATEYHDTYKTESKKQSNDLCKNPTEITFCQPVVILDGILTTAELSADGDIIIEQVHSAAFKFEYKTEHYNESHYRVDVITIEGLEEYLELLEKRQNNLSKAIFNNSEFFEENKRVNKE